MIADNLADKMVALACDDNGNLNGKSFADLSIAGMFY